MKPRTGSFRPEHNRGLGDSIDQVKMPATRATLKRSSATKGRSTHLLRECQSTNAPFAIRNIQRRIRVSLPASVHQIFHHPPAKVQGFGIVG
jgi:hypothetical protein